ncbi:Fc.00g000910.m01.CDS01 [Cosmosporella sp. VM-42]
MLFLVYFVVSISLLFLLEPLVTYLWDPKKLRRFPGQNALSGISTLGYILERYHGFRSKTLHAIHQHHPIVRIGPNSVSFSTPDAIRSIYGHSTTCTKGDMYLVAAGAHFSILDVVDKAEHARKRRLLSHAFATRNLELWEFKVTDKTQRLVCQFDRICNDGVTDTIDYGWWVNLFTIEAIADIALSHHLGCLDNGNDLVTIPTPSGGEKTFGYIDCLHASRRATSMVVWATAWFPLLRFVLRKTPGFFRSQWSKGDCFDEMVRHFVQRRIKRHQDGEELDDLVACLLTDKEGKPRGIETSEIEAEATVFFDAGSDTTAIALAHVMYYLLRTPSTLARLRQELDMALAGCDAIPSYDGVKNLPYLRACLDESLRLSPPVSFGINRKTPPEGLSIDGHWIAGNTTVGVPAYTAHRNRRLFPEPEKFRPERWLEENARDAQASFIPFSAGARGCIGRNITYIEQTILIATLVRRYDFELPHPEWELKHEEGFNLWTGPLPLKIRLRDVKG